MRRPVVAVHQPNYLPWLGWFAKAVVADVLVLLDDVQFEKGGYTNRVRVGAAAGPVLLSVPVRRPRGLATTVREVEIGADPRWRDRHGRTLRQAYGNCPGWQDHGEALLGGLNAPGGLLADLNGRLLQILLPALGATADVVRASDLPPRQGGASAGLASICAALGAGTYLSGAGGRKYLDEEPFRTAGIDVAFSPFRHPVYDQPWGEPFEPGLSAVDLLLRRPADAADLLRASVS